jgi:oxygen-independent coproporphyrinogen-3 oxidase
MSALTLQGSAIPASDDPYRALYVHLPFCASRCAYCDFTTEAVPASDERIDRYVEGLVRAVRAATREGLLGTVETVYIGGGTPTHIGLRRLVSLIYTLSLSLLLTPDTEFTLEANPESLSPQLARDVFALGVTRFSLGVQSFDDAELRALGRPHDARTAHAAIDAARERCENVSVDLMCGIPCQTKRSWDRTLDAVLAHDVSHVSVYPLTLEEGTPMAKAVCLGSVASPDEDLQAQMMLAASARLEAAGLTRYEVASYARPAAHCRHNKAYWTGLPYLGIGAGAVSMRMAGGMRERLLDGSVQERLSPLEADVEDLMLGMRLREGVASLRVREVSARLPQLSAAFDELVSLGLVMRDNDRLCVTERGWLLGNEVFARIWSCVTVQ